MSDRREIVVGYDASPDAASALDWAVAEAVSAHRPVRMVYVEPDLSGWDSSAATMAGAPVLPPLQVPEPTDLLNEAVEKVRAAGVEVTLESRIGSTAGVLVDSSRAAGLVVIGSRGLGSISSAVLGSTVAHVASHAHCPVVVVRSQTTVGGPVVVGVDGSPQSEVVLAWAFDFAARHGLALEVLHLYAIPVYPGVVPYVPPAGITEATAHFEQRVAREVLAGWAEQYPEVAVSTTVTHGRPAPALIEASARASVTVVGSRGRGAFLGMLLGSTSQSLLQHAHGTVAVLRTPH